MKAHNENVFVKQAIIENVVIISEKILVTNHKVELLVDVAD